MFDTGRLITNLLKVKSITEFLETYSNYYNENTSFSRYLNILIKAKKLKKSQIIKDSTIDKTYAYELLRGKRDNPSRNKVIMFAFGLHLDVKDTQVFLTEVGYAALNPKDKREAIIIYALARKVDIISLNLMLDKHKQPLLS